MKIMIGTDPEFFMKDKETGQLVSAIPFIKGDKFNPEPLPAGGNIQSDNVAVEFSTLPMNSAEAFVAHMKATLADMIHYIPKQFSIETIPSALFPKEELKDERACQFGCSPDYCAWDLVVNDPPRHPNAQFRSCGGHVHVGCVDSNGTPIHEDSQFLLQPMGKVTMVRGMDLFLGIVSTILDNSKESVERRSLYGKAGCHRPTSYGVEYRALSNWWTKCPESVMLITYLTEDVVEAIAAGKLEGLVEQVGQDALRSTIDTGNVEQAKRIFEGVVAPNLSDNSKHFFEVCKTKLAKPVELAMAWGI